jgi:hypothetical protein
MRSERSGRERDRRLRRAKPKREIAGRLARRARLAAQRAGRGEVEDLRPAQVFLAATRPPRTAPPALDDYTIGAHRGVIGRCERTSRSAPSIQSVRRHRAPWSAIDQVDVRASRA